MSGRACGVRAQARMIFVLVLPEENRLFADVRQEVASSHTHLPFTFSCKCLVVFAECQPGFFKDAASDDKCQPCPANTEKQSAGAQFCPCIDGFYRAATDAPSGPCSGNQCPDAKHIKHKEMLSASASRLRNGIPVHDFFGAL